jgi:G3E family GTPase
VALKKEIKRNHNPDFLFIEPSEMVVTQEMRNVLSMGLRDIAYDIGPLITLVNGLEFDIQWQERTFLMLGQISDADMVALTQSDLMEESAVREIGQRLVAHTGHLLPMSVPCNVGVNEIMTAIRGQAARRYELQPSEK